VARVSRAGSFSAQPARLPLQMFDTAASTAVVAVGGIEFAFGAQAGTPLSGASTGSVVPSRSAFAVRLFGVGSLASDTDALQFFFDRLYVASGANIRVQGAV
jgi:hypothetical protein